MNCGDVQVRIGRLSHRIDDWWQSAERSFDSLLRLNDLKWPPSDTAESAKLSNGIYGVPAERWANRHVSEGLVVHLTRTQWE